MQVCTTSDRRQLLPTIKRGRFTSEPRFFIARLLFSHGLRHGLRIQEKRLSIGRCNWCWQWRGAL